MRLSLPYSPKELDDGYYDYYETMYLDGLKYNTQNDFKHHIQYDFIGTGRFYSFMTSIPPDHPERYDYNATLGSYYGAGNFRALGSQHTTTTFTWPSWLWRTKQIPIPKKISFTLNRINHTGSCVFKLLISGNVSGTTKTIVQQMSYSNVTFASFTNKLYEYTDIKNKFLGPNDTSCVLYWYCPNKMSGSCTGCSTNYYSGPMDPLYIKDFIISFK